MDSKMGKGEWVILYVIAGVIDALQFLIDFTGIGIAANAIIDPFVGIVLGIYFWVRKSLNIFAAISFISAIFLKEGTFGVAPAWIIVIGLVHVNIIRQKAAAIIINKVAGPSEGPLNRAGMRLPSKPSPVNQGGTRPPRKDEEISLSE